MKKIYLKFIIDVSLFFLIALISVASIVWVIQAVNFLDFVSEDGHSFTTYFKYTLLVFPKTVGKIYPFIFFLSLFYIITKYENNNELIIFWTHGITKRKLMNVVLNYSLCCAFILIVLTLYIVPNSQDKARSYIRASSIDLFPSLIKEQSFNDTVNNLSIFVEKKNQNGEFQNIFLKDSSGFTNLNRNFNIIFAEKGFFKNYNGMNYLTLLNGNFLLSDNQKITNFTFEKIDFDLSKFSTKTTTYVKVQELKTSYLIRCIYKLKTKDAFSSSDTFLLFKDVNKRCAEKFLPEASEEMFKRIIVVFYIPILGLLSSLLLLTSKDQPNYHSKKILIFALSITAIIIHEFSSQYFISNLFTFFLCLSLPIIINLSIYSYIDKKLRFN